MFTKQDFEWNNASNPSAHRGVRGLSLAGEEMEWLSPGLDAQGLVIVMNRVDMRNVLFERLMHGRLSAEECLDIGRGLAESLRRVRAVSPGIENYFSIFHDRIADSRA